MDRKYISVKGARVNNLKNIDVEIPRNSFVVVTGVSGSGKSSLAFDTLYAEGQRRYVESLSSYARQFLGRMSKPECDYIKGLPPAVAIEQKVNSRNPRSTVGTSTEIYDYLRMLYARVGRTYSPLSGEEVKKHSMEDIFCALSQYPIGSRIAILVNIHLSEGRSFNQQLEIYLKEGFSRLEHKHEFIEIDSVINSAEPISAEYCRLLIDRLSISNDKDEQSRLADSIETAYYEGKEECVILVWANGEVKEHTFSKKFTSDGIDFREPSDLMFNFNNPYGACEECEGFGKIIGIDEDLVIPNKTLSIYQDAVQCWKGEKMSECKRDLISVASKYKFPIHTAYCDLTEEEKIFLWRGEGEWYGIDGFFKWVDENQYKIQYRVLKARYRGKTTCPKCHGSRLKKDVEYVKIGGKSITEIVKMPITNVMLFFENLTLNEIERQIGSRLLKEINSRLEFLNDVGLGYLTLDRLSSTLSGGESQRINLATSLSSSLVGSLYILDEPSIGLHSKDTDNLLRVLKKLQNIGNTVVVVEHDEDIMRAADYIIDIGKDAGRLGGNIVYCGNLDTAISDDSIKDSHTIDYLKGDRVISYNSMRRPWKKYIEILGAREHNLKDIDVKFPLGVLSVVTGVSGSGKSTLVREILYKSMMRQLGESSDTPGAYKGLAGDYKDIKVVEFVNQNPIGTSTRSNPATYLKAYDEIRRLFGDLQISHQMGYTASHFSFNSDGGRCEECKGEGVITIPMQFMADITIECDECHGHRFKQDILDVCYRGKNISDILDMTINQAIEFFAEHDGAAENRIIRRLEPLRDVGLGYIKLGQSSSTLSGGENQRVKLAYFIGKEKQEHTLFIFDEPTTGLHFHDISTLLKSFNRLIEKGHTVVIIEHNLDVIKSADWIIDIGPEGGDKGGRVVAEGTPESVAKSEMSITGKYLKMKLDNKI